jgi:hypothetical protein
MEVVEAPIFLPLGRSGSRMDFLAQSPVKQLSSLGRPRTNRQERPVEKLTATWSATLWGWRDGVGIRQRRLTFKAGAGIKAFRVSLRR